MGASANFFQTILENIEDGVWVSDKNDVIIYANKAMAKIAGITVEQIKGNNVLTDFAEETISEFIEFYRKAKSKLEPVWYEVTVKTPAGRDSWQNGWLIPQKDNNGNFNGIVTTVRDVTKRVITEQILKENKEKYFQLVETASDAIYLIDANGKVIDTNASACNMLGRTKEEMLKLSFHDIDPNFTPREFIDFWKNVPYNEHRIFETTHLKKDGSRVPVEVSGKKFKIEELDFYYGIARDISERKKDQVKFEESLKKYQLLVENQNELVVKFDISHKVIYANPNYCKTYGLSEKEIIEKSFFPQIHEDDRENVRKSLNSIHKPPHKSYHEERAKTVHGWKWLGWSLNGITDKNNKVVEIIAVGRDISRQKQAELELKQSEKKYRTVIETSIDSFWINNKEGKFMEVNPAFCRMTGYSKDELLNMSISDIEADESATEVSMHIYEVLKTGSDRFQTKQRTKNGNIIDVEISVHYNSDNDIFFAYGKNITEQIRAELALKASEEKFRSLFKAVPVPTFTWQREGDDFILLDYNESARLFTGDKITDFIGIKASKMYHDNKKIFSDLEACYKNKSVFGREMGYKLKTTGETKYLNVKYAFVPPNLILVHTEDFTERKRAEIMLRDEKERIRTILDLVGDPIFVKDNNHRFSLANSAFCEIFGKDEKSIIGHTLIEEVPESETEHFFKTDRYVLDTGKSDLREEVITVGGIKRNIITKKTRFIDESGEKFLVGSIHDITDRKQAEAELKKHRENLEEMVKERTAELEQKNKELEQYNQLFVGREFRIKELKDKIADLEKQLKNT